MTPESFAELSRNAVIAASVVYVLAMLAHFAEWATALASARVASRTTAPERETVPARVGGPSDGPAGAVVDEDAAFRTDRWGRIGIALTVVAAALHLVGTVARSFAADPWRVPWGNMYEFTLTGTLGVSLIYLALLRRQRLRWMGLFVTVFQVVVLMCANLFLEEAAGPLVPALHSYWLVVHVGAAVLATGAFSVGALAAVMYLVKDRADRRGSTRFAGLLAQFPSTDALDRLSYRLHAVGFPIWTFAALIAGPIWAEYAWGRYWNWDPKEVWAFVTWVVYAAYLHARATAGWRGRAAAIVALVAFATLLFNFVGINFFFGAGSLHSYAG